MSVTVPSGLAFTYAVAVSVPMIAGPPSPPRHDRARRGADPRPHMGGSREEREGAAGFVFPFRRRGVGPDDRGPPQPGRGGRDADPAPFPAAGAAGPPPRGGPPRLP